MSVKHPYFCEGANSFSAHMDKELLPANITSRGEYSVDNKGKVFYHHHLMDCSGHCCFHVPSDHHMVSWPLNWRPDRQMMERMCPHGVGHPDPDDRSKNTVHGCDGCCVK